MLIFSTTRISFSSIMAEYNEEKRVMFATVIEELIREGIDTNFIFRTIDHPNTIFNERFVKINVNNFASSPDYSHNWSEKAVWRALKFINENKAVLNLAELQYNVPKEIIASILFIETKYGEYLGNNSILSVYYSTALCNKREFIDKNKQSLRDSFKGSDSELTSLLSKIDERSEKKSKWAIEQLKAIYEMEKNAKISIFDLKGSWAGAFGISQFIPTSYLSWAVDGNNDGNINLFDVTDAIFSVANYLKSNGWCDDSIPNRKAVFHYNNSSAYVDAVFKLANLTSESLKKTSNLQED